MSLQLSVKTPNGSVSATLDVEPTDTLADVKQHLHNKTDIPTEQQRLLFAGRQLEDDTLTVSECGIKEGDASLHLVLKARLDDGTYV